MPRTVTLTDGTTSVSLLATTGIIASRGGFGGFSLDGSVIDELYGDIRGQVAESYKLNLIGSSHDNAASQLQTFLRLLRKAALHHATSWQTTPVYLQVQTTGETGARYARVFGAKELSLPDFFAHPFELDNWIEEFGLTIIREGVWRASAPGTLSGLSPITLTASDGPADPTRVVVANHRDDIPLTHVFNADRALTSVELNPTGDDILASGAPTQNYGSLDPDGLGVGEDNSAANIFRSLLKFDLSGISAGSEIVSATLSLYATTDKSSNARVFRVFRQKRAWTEAGATWNKYDGANDWQTAGGFGADDCEQTDIGSRTFQAAGESGYCAFTLTLSAIQAIIDGTWTDKGLMVKADTETDDAWRFSSREAAAGQRPKLVVSYFTAPVYSANLFGSAAHDIFAVSGSTPDVGDCHYLGSTTGPWHTTVFNIGTAAIWNVVLTYEYWNGAAWTALVSDTNVTLYPAFDKFASTGVYVLSVGHIANWAATTVNGVSAWWVRIRISTFTSHTTTPANATTAIYAQKTPTVEFSAVRIKGDTFPFALMRLLTPAAGDDDEGFPNLSRVLVGAKSRNLSTFVSHLLAATNGNPSGWAAAYGTDTSETTADSVSPRGARATCTFATDASLVARVNLTGTGKLGSWIGTYRAFIRCQQIGGAAGDCSLRLRICLGSTATADPKWETTIVKLAAADKGAEVVDLGQIILPWIEPAAGDAWTNIDLIFQVFAQRASGASTLRIYDLILIPIDEWACVFDDPISNPVTGSSALRGNNALEIDTGIIRNRVVKMSRSGADLYPIETWNRAGPPIKLEPLRQTRLYFLMMHYPAGGQWGTGPMIATLGMQVQAEIYSVPCYFALRGGD